MNTVKDTKIIKKVLKEKYIVGQYIQSKYIQVIIMKLYSIDELKND